MDVGESIRDVILRITGDGDDARRELERLSLELTKFGRKEAEADARIDTAKAKKDLKALEAQFARIDGRDLSATANVRLGKAMAELASLQAAIDAVDGDDIEIDVKVEKDLEERLQGLGGKAAQFADHLGDVERRSTSAGEALADTNVNVLNMNTRMGTLLKLLPGLIPILVGVVAQVVAMGASAVQAAGGLGAMVIALGGAFTSALAIGGAAVFRFQETMDQAGTPANKIVEVVGKIGEALQSLSKAADPILHAIANNIGGVFDVIERVRPAFFKLGKEAGQAVSWMMKALTSPAMADGIAKLLELSGPVMKPLAQIFVRFGRVLLNIANAAMPFLTEALQGLAKWLGEAVKGTSDMANTRGAVGEMVDHLRSWFNLLVQIGGVLGDVVRIAAPFGKELVDALAKGAEHLREWLDSDEGTKRVQEFFEQVLPLAGEFAKLVGNLIVIFLQFGQLMAPVWRPIVAGINDVMKPIQFLLELLNKVPAPIREAVGTIAMLVFGFGKFKVAGMGVVAAVRLLLGALGLIGGALGGVWGEIKDFTKKLPELATAVFSAAKEIAGDAVDAVKSVFNDAKEAGKEVFEKVGAGISDAADFVVRIADDVINAVVDQVKTWFTDALSAGRDLFEKVKNGINDARSAVTGAATAVAQAALQKVRDLFNTALNVGRDLFEKVKGGINDARSAVATAARDVVGAVLDQVRNAFDNAIKVGSDLFNKVKNGINNAWKDVTDAAREVTKAAIDVVENMAEAAFKAGETLAKNIANGIKKLPSLLGDALSAAGGIAADVGRAIRNWVNDNTMFGDHIHIGLPGPAPDIDFDIPALARGVRNFMGGVALVGEEGPELVNLPDGADVFTKNDTRRILEKLAEPRTTAEAQLFGASSGDGKSSGPMIGNLNVTPVAGGGSPDPETFAAQLIMALRVRAATVTG